MKRTKIAKALRRHICALGEAGILEPRQKEAVSKSLEKILTSVQRRDFAALNAALEEFLRNLIADQE